MTRSPRRRRFAAALAVTSLLSLVLVLAACSSNSTTSATQGATSSSSTAGGSASESASASGGQVVKLSGLKFDPATLTISVGTKVTFQNLDNVDHTVTNGKDGAPETNSLFDQSVPQGASFEFTFTKAGSVNVTCKVHKFMNMTITVQ
jgi:plastocyanin